MSFPALRVLTIGTMSNANSGDRMATRGDTKGKMSRVMAIVCSGGIEDSLPEDSKTAKKELEDAFMKKLVDTRASHPHRWTVDSEDGRATTLDSDPENNGVDKTAEHNEHKFLYFDTLMPGLYAQYAWPQATMPRPRPVHPQAAMPRPRPVHPQAATPRPRPVHPQKGTGEESWSEDLDTAPQVKEKAVVRGAITRVESVDTKMVNADETGPQDTDKTVKASSDSKSAHAMATCPTHKETQKPDKGPLSDHRLEGYSDDDKESDLDGPPLKNSKTKAAGKKKTKGTKAKLIREQFKSNRKLVTEARPNSEKRKVLSLKANTIVSKATSKAKTTSAKSASCAVISTSTSSVLAKLVRRARHRYEELESASDASDEVEEMAPGGMDDDYDDTLEQAAAVLSPLGAPAAAQRNKKNLDIRTGIASPNRTKKPKKRNNSELPGGALDAGRWSGVFIPTFLRYLGGMEKDIWAFKRKDAVHVLQAVWNTVYAGSTDGSMSKIKHLVEIGGTMHEVSVQRATEWRNAIGATRLSIVQVGDFMDSTGLNTTEARWEAVDQLLADERYVYLKTKDVVEDGVPARDLSTSCSLALGQRSGYISKESYDAALGQKKSGILKVLGPDGKCTKTTNFSKEQWEEISDIHIRDVWSVEQEKLQVIRGDINKAVDQIHNHKPTKCRAGGREADQSDPQTRWEHGGKVLTQVWQASTYFSHFIQVLRSPGSSAFIVQGTLSGWANRAGLLTKHGSGGSDTAEERTGKWAIL
ncbi:hypothetical protein EDB85DRAFT_1895658 [Lactarius pseudohatsudake]|nr:hypothetical protein EDB85DRAFT_1895658 [Lactarius pseudohatsudake]